MDDGSPPPLGGNPRPAGGFASLDADQTDPDRDGNAPPGRGTVRAFTLWPGTNRPLLGGRCITGPRSDTLFNAFTWAALMGVSALFMGTAGPKLWADVSPAFVLVVAGSWALVSSSVAVRPWGGCGCLRSPIQRF